MKLKFRPVMTRQLAVADTKAFEAALKASDRFGIVETRRTITFRFRKRQRSPPRQADTGGS